MIPHHLTELIRLLEQRQYPFPIDPTAITEQLRHTHQELSEKLHHRAQLIDRDKKLADRLHRHQRHWHWLMLMATAAWGIFGFLGTYHLMQHSALNFFVLLVGILGMNTLMLLIWCVNSLFRRHSRLSLPPLHFGRMDDVHHAMIQLYTEQAMRPHGIWRKNIVIHRLALAGLSGMFLAALMLLLVRQYRFTWESTLLSNQSFSKMVALLSWLPEKLGFDVPHTAAILASRNQLDAQNAAAWGSLLLGSLLCYGILPRVMAWGLSVWQARRYPHQLALDLPYYQNIIQKWQRRIIDSDADYQPDTLTPPPPTPKTTTHQTAYWAAMMDVAHHNPQWYQNVLGKDWLDKGVIASRDDWHHLAQQTAERDIHLLIAVHATQTPDRGTIRRLVALHAPITLLLWRHEHETNDSERLTQWHDLAEHYQWAYLNA